MLHAFCQEVIAGGPNIVRENKQTEKSLLQLLCKRNKRICMLVLGKVVQWRGVAAVGAITEGNSEQLFLNARSQI